ncbi:MAG: cytochrome B5 [Thermoleophilia bacterium]|nr:cytochrome B5 [Thermoleophilia bacterium]
MLKLTPAELAKYNGRGGAPAYVAYEGKIYDVSSSFLWQRGRHQAMHEAGTDLTQALAQAPHGKEFLERFPVVGILVE